MSNPSSSLFNFASRYATTRAIRLEHSLGFGKDGSVWATTAFTAIKAYDSPTAYQAERDCYFRLGEMHVRSVLGHNVPTMIGHSDDFMVIEMTIVPPPYILDFASAHLDYTPDFPAEVLEQWEADRLEEFGKNWPHVRSIIDFMADQYGIFLLDVHPRNITFPPDKNPL